MASGEHLERHTAPVEAVTARGPTRRIDANVGGGPSPGSPPPPTAACLCFKPLCILEKTHKLAKQRNENIGRSFQAQGLRWPKFGWRTCQQAPIRGESNQYEINRVRFDFRLLSSQEGFLAISLRTQSTSMPSTSAMILADRAPIGELPAQTTSFFRSSPSTLNR